MRRHPKKCTSNCLVQSELGVDNFQINHSMRGKRKREPADIDGQDVRYVWVLTSGNTFHTGCSLFDPQENEGMRPKPKKIQPTKRLLPPTTKHNAVGTHGDEMNRQGPTASSVADRSALLSLPHAVAVADFWRKVLQKPCCHSPSLPLLSRNRRSPLGLRNVSVLGYRWSRFAISKQGVVKINSEHILLFRCRHGVRGYVIKSFPGCV